MIQTIVTHRCPKCGSKNMVRNGHDYKGDQKYYCKTCESYGTLDAQRGYDEQARSQVKRAVLERISFLRVCWLNCTSVRNFRLKQDGVQ